MKQERLSGLLQIEHLFKTGKVFSIPPLRIVYAYPEDQEQVPVRVLITVSSRKFKRAVDRNRIRRKIREAYRLNKSALYTGLLNAGSRLLLGIIYTGEEADPDYHLIENRLLQCLGRLEKNARY
jgi:ribonuclease P protein component